LVGYVVRPEWQNEPDRVGLGVGAIDPLRSARFTSLCGVLGARQRASSTLRACGGRAVSSASGLSRTSLASGIIPSLIRDSLAMKSGRRHEPRTPLARSGQSAASAPAV